ncbi:amino acid permease/ SLC12A domain-containing protein, partial [Flammula alnicola]
LHPFLFCYGPTMEQYELPVLRKTNAGRPSKFDAARIRLDKYQKRWSEIGKELPPQINRSEYFPVQLPPQFSEGPFAVSVISVVSKSCISEPQAIRHAGPVGTLLGYIITGTVVWSVVISIGEIVAFLPNVGGPVGLAGLYVDPALGFALGWNAWYNWTIILPTELSAAAILLMASFHNLQNLSVLITYFNPVNLRNSNIIAITVMPMSIFVVFLAILINCFGSRAYGEAEFIFSCFKILTIVGLIIAGITLDLGGGKEGFIGLRYWRSPGPFVAYRAKGSLGMFLGVWSSMSQAVFAFFGTEVPGVAAGENIPRAINRVWIRITLFYVLAVFVAGLLVSSDDENLKGPSAGSAGHSLVLSSPFVIALPVSDVYISSRFLYYLGRCGHAPAFCTRIISSKRNKTTIPWVGILVSACFGLLAYMSISQSSAEEVFHWLSSMNSTTALLSWIGMLFTYIR